MNLYVCSFYIFLIFLLWLEFIGKKKDDEINVFVRLN